MATVTENGECRKALVLSVFLLGLHTETGIGRVSEVGQGEVRGKTKRDDRKGILLRAGRRSSVRKG